MVPNSVLAKDLGSGSTPDFHQRRWWVVVGLDVAGSVQGDGEDV